MRVSFPKTLNAREGENQMKKDKLMRMNLQYFAEEGAEEEVTTEVDTAEETNVDTDKVVEKLQQRLASKTKAEKESKSQLEQALLRIEELENAGKKGVKELSDEEKATKAQQEKDDEIEKLRNQIKVAESTQQADEVLKDAGLVVGKDILSMLVSTDDESTLSNVKALISYTNEQRKAWEVARNTGTTPRKTPGQEEIDPFTAATKKYT